MKNPFRRKGNKGDAAAPRGPEPASPEAAHGAHGAEAEAPHAEAPDPEGDADTAPAEGEAAPTERARADAQPAAPEAPEPDEAAPEKARKPGFLARLRAGLAKSSGKLSSGIGAIFDRRKLDEDTLEELEDLLIAADLGPRTANKLCEALAESRFGKTVGAEEVKTALADQAAGILRPLAQPLRIDPAKAPHIVLVAGVNGTGKTTTIGKLAQQYRDEGYTVAVAAGDTFRAAAVEQLRVWGERAGATVFSRATGADAAGLVYDAIEQARRDGADVLLIDTAGRLQNKQTLMAELQKIVRVIRKLAPDGPHDAVLVLDATTGQNAVSQAETFKDMIDVTGLVVTKLDGSARGGVLVAVADRLGLPIHAVGVGEGVHDLKPFDPDAFARSLLGLEPVE